MIAWWSALLAGLAGVYLGAILVSAFVVASRSRADRWAADTFDEIQQLPEVHA